MSQPMGRLNQSLTDRLPLVEGALFGAIAFVAGIVVTYVLAQLDSNLSDRIDQLTGGSIDVAEFDTGISALDAVIWVFFEAHLVDIESTVEGGGQAGSSTVNLLSEAAFPALLYTAVIAVVLVVAGFLLGQRAGPSSGQEGATYGAMVVIGYLPLTLVSIFLSRVSESTTVLGTTLSATIEPDIVTALVLAGLLFPLALGALGGYLAFRQQPSRSQFGR